MPQAPMAMQPALTGVLLVPTAMLLALTGCHRRPRRCCSRSSGAQILTRGGGEYDLKIHCTHISLLHGFALRAGGTAVGGDDGAAPPHRVLLRAFVRWGALQPSANPVLQAPNTLVL
eukprot:gene10239-biopygen721